MGADYAEDIVFGHPFDCQYLLTTLLRFCKRKTKLSHIDCHSFHILFR